MESTRSHSTKGAARARGGVSPLDPVLRHTDLVLALLVATVVAMMILPLPTWVMDALIATNIAMSVTLLVSVLYAAEPLAIATFPTILLLTTLFRLALNISTTRLILTQANAGRIIDAFGNFVVSGNYVVGGVIFVIITLVQFLVIAKGSERVAEVAARFTLDAMPGKQMSIDADLRSGIVDGAGARARRRGLEREAQFYGAMDGAMKFVKGDAIAGICITCANILAGLVIGIWQMKMDAAEALQVFTILTIGDGLVSQIPALILSTAAGFLVTRVASEDAGSHLGAEVARQVIAQPRALKIVALMLFGLALVPGFPIGPFVALGLLAGFMAYAVERGAGIRAAVARLRPGGKPAAGSADGSGDGSTGSTDLPAADAPLVVQVLLDVSPSVAGRSGEDARAALDREIPAMRARLRDDLGLTLPSVGVRVGDPAEPGADFVVRIREVPAARGRIPAGRIFCSIPPRQLSDGGIDAAPAHDPVTGQEGGWIDADIEKRARAFGCPVLTGPGYVIASLEEAVRRRAADLVGIQEVQDLLDALERTSPALVRTTVPKPVDLRTLADVSRRLVEEGVSLRYMSEILESLSRWAGTQKDPVALTELVRAALSRPISARHASQDGEGIDVILVAPSVEEAIRASIHRSDHGSFLALDPESARDMVSAVTVEVASFPWTATRVPVIVTQSDTRRFLRKLVEIDHPRVAVLSYQEIDPALALRPTGEIAVGRSKRT